MIRILYQNDLKSLFYIFFLHMWHRNTMNKYLLMLMNDDVSLKKFKKGPFFGLKCI